MPAIVRDSEQAERLQVALIENMVREDLNPVDEARACAALVEDLGLSKEELARRVGRSRPAVSNLIRLLDLPDEALELLESGELSEGHGRALLGAAATTSAAASPATRPGAAGRCARPRTGSSWLASQRRRRALAQRLDAEEAAALREAADQLESALGHEVKVRPKGGGDRGRDPLRRPRRGAGAGPQLGRRAAEHAACGPIPRYHRWLRAISSVG